MKPIPDESLPERRPCSGCGFLMRGEGEVLTCGDCREYGPPVKSRPSKASYRGVCETCGARPDDSGGRAQAPRLCTTCSHAKQVAEIAAVLGYSPSTVYDYLSDPDGFKQRARKVKRSPEAAT